jgi:hypothetical protein
MPICGCKCAWIALLRAQQRSGGGGLLFLEQPGLGQLVEPPLELFFDSLGGEHRRLIAQDASQLGAGRTLDEGLPGRDGHPLNRQHPTVEEVERKDLIAVETPRQELAYP